MLESPPDKPRSRTTPETAQIELRWSAAASRALTPMKTESPRRALNAAARYAIKAALHSAPPLYSPLQNRLKSASLRNWQIDFSWVDDAAMTRLNAQHRGKDRPTDVLSFPLWEGDFIFPDPTPDAEIALGDMVISIETAARQAQELKHDLRAEIAFLSIHGVLHLLGYDHDNATARRRMFALQDQIFERLREEKKF